MHFRYFSGTRGADPNSSRLFEPHATNPRPIQEPTLGAMQAPADELLIGRIARGDRLAMQVLFARHHVRIYRYVLRLMRDEMAAEDVISEVFLDVWRQANRFEGRSAVSTWLIAIARFKALSVLRKRREEGLDDEMAEQIEEPSDDPGLATEKSDKGEKLRQCLAALTPEHREVIDLVYYHEKSVEEAAQIIGIPENTVKTRMFYARKKLGELCRMAGIDRGWP
jgi:RNA polymerase sigma-70 factor, ECF subfamily